MTSAALCRPAGAELRLGVVLLALTAGAWWLSADRMAGMDAVPGAQLGGIDWFALTWLVMMAAMMLPVLAPMVATFGARAAGAGATAAFAGAYLLTWLAAGLMGYAAIDGVRLLNLGFLAWGSGGRYVAGGVLAIAGLYQLTPAKQSYLRRCRERRSFMHEQWRPGHIGALRMGVAHGGYCIGASWALMATLFALGVMSLAWMATITVLIAAERLLDRRSRLVVAALLIALGVSVALAPDAVPALTVPRSLPMHEMQGG